MSAKDVTKLSAIICERVIAMPEFVAANTVMLYSPIRNEVDPQHILQVCRTFGKTVALPRTFKESRRIVPVELATGAVPVAGAYGIFEPPADADVLDASAIDFVCVPGVAFSAACARIGYGGGYYDRFLATPGYRGFSCGLAFSVQLSEWLPTQAWDSPLDAVASELGLYRRQTAK